MTHAENMRRGHSRIGMNIYKNSGTCTMGHDITEDSAVYISKSGRRSCKLCATRRQREYLDRKKQSKQ